MSGLIEAFTYAAGASLNLAGGVRLTRVAQASNIGDTELVLERTLGLPATGQLQIDNVTYTYKSVRDGAVGTLSVVTPQGTFYGVQLAHALGAVVVDASRSYSALDAIRGGLFVDTAEGDDLSILGRLLGVPRLADVADDDVYRAIIKAIAYSPRPTRTGLTAALNAIVGAGNFVLSEDPTQPGVVQIFIDAAQMLNGEAWGKWYVSGQVPAALGDDGVLHADGPLLSINAVHAAPVSFYGDVTAALPSAYSYSDSARGTVKPWSFAGDESAVVQAATGPGVSGWKLASGSYYVAQTHKAPGDGLSASVQWLVTDASALSSTDARGMALRLHTSGRACGAGVVRQADGTLGVGLADLSAANAGLLIAGAAVVKAGNVPFTVSVHTDVAQGVAVLRVDGSIVQRLPLSAAATPDGASGPSTVAVGALNGSCKSIVLLAMGLTTEPLDDLAAWRGQATPAASDTLTLMVAPEAAWAGLSLTVLSGGGAAQGAGARGVYPIASISSSANTVTAGPQVLPTLALLGARAVASGPYAPFVYPDDIGRTLRITESSSGNAGDYVVAAVLADDNLTDRATAPQSGLCCSYGVRVQKAFSAADSAASATLLPNFGTQPARIVVAGASDVSGLGDVTASVTPASALPAGVDAAVFAADVVLSGQLVDNTGPVNHRLTDGPPPTYLLWPTYLYEPVHLAETYLSAMVALGVSVQVIAGLENAQ